MPEDVFHLTPEEAATALRWRHPLTDVRDSDLRQRGQPHVKKMLADAGITTEQVIKKRAKHSISSRE